jgi:phage terminase large subunit-like protein
MGRRSAVALDLTRDWRQVPRERLSRGDKVIGFIETHLKIPEGSRVGEPFLLEPWQQRFIRRVYDNPASTRRAILSLGRKNGKTSLTAALVLAYVCGPLAVRNAQIIAGAMSRDQAALIFDLARKSLLFSPLLQTLVAITPSVKKLVGLATGVEFQAISADATTAMGRSPLVAILDEIGQIRGPTSPFVDAVVTAQGAYAEPLQIILSTQAATDADLLSIMIDDAQKSGDPQTVLELHSAPPDCELDDLEAWRASNPGLGTIRSLEDVRRQAETALRLPSAEVAFRNLILNQRTALVAPFLTPSVWQRNAGEVTRTLFYDGRKVFGGLDLSARTDLTSLVLTCLDDDGNALLWQITWTPGASIVDRGFRDRAPYVAWQKSGVLQAIPGETIQYDEVAARIGQTVAGMRLVKLAVDPWRISVFRESLQRLELSTLPIVEHHQGFRSMSPAVETFEERALNGRLLHGGDPLLTWSFSNAVIVSDPAGNRKLDKSKSYGRIDPAIAAVMAVSAMEVDQKPILEVGGMIG